ncbi:MAG: sugar phosphate nucleotidyltransferase [Caulobacteraceae bacterium]
MGGSLAPTAGPRAAPEQCVILVGGLGSRLGDLTGGLPKPLTAVAGKPFLSYLLWHVQRMGFERVLLLAGHRAQHVLEYRDQLAQQSRLRVEVAIEPQPLGTAGALRFASDRLAPNFLLLNGDSLFDFNWLDLVTATGPAVDAVMAVRRAADASRFGVVELAGEQVTRFRERGDATGGLINGGVYMLTQDLAQACPVTGSLEQEVLPRLAAAGRVVAREQTGFFLDIGVPDALAAAQTSVPASMTRGATIFTLKDVAEPSTVADQVCAKPGAVAAIKAANDAGRFAFLETHGLDIAGGWSERDHALLQDVLRRHGAHLDDVITTPQTERVGPASLSPPSLNQRLEDWPVDLSDIG